MRVLIVRLSSLGDVIHATPVAAALRRRFPDATIDWVVDEVNAQVLTLVPVIDRRIVLQTRSRSTISAWMAVRRDLRERRYDIALDVQGLCKSALMARLSGARKVIGFDRPFLRESWAKWFYDAVVDVGEPVHVVERNLGILKAVSVAVDEWEFPFKLDESEIGDKLSTRLNNSLEQFVLLNPNTAWKNKCWPPDRFGAVAAHIRSVHGLSSLVVWGPGDEERADAVVAASSGAATRAPESSLVELAAMLSGGMLLVSGDTGVLHLAAGRRVFNRRRTTPPPQRYTNPRA